MAGLFSGELFPTKSSFVVFIAYMALFINQGILIRSSSSGDGKYKYNTVTVVLLTECVKLIAATIFFLKEKTFSELISDIITHRKVLAYYFIPASLYCLYNNLGFINLGAYDPTTYYLLLQFRVVVTGVLFQILFQKKLSRIQWLSLLLLTVGCIIKEVNHEASAKPKEGVESEKSWLSYVDPHLLLIFVQVLSSCGAGVYNEFLLKVSGLEVHIMVQNVFMYLNSIVCNLIALQLRGELTQAFTQESLTQVIQPIVIVIMLNNAAIGIVTSLFLRSLNSILKVFASALELMFTAVLCWIIFGIKIDVFTVISIFIVSGAIYVYAQNPVVNLPKGSLPMVEEKQHNPRSSPRSSPTRETGDHQV